MINKVPNIVKAWCNAISKRSPERMLSFYGKEPVLLATYDTMLIGREELYDYFVEFLDKRNLECELNDNYTQMYIGRDMFVSSGTYTFSFTNEDGVFTQVEARYSFVVLGNKIVNHHSSVDPVN